MHSHCSPSTICYSHTTSAFKNFLEFHFVEEFDQNIDYSKHTSQNIVKSIESRVLDNIFVYYLELGKE